MSTWILLIIITGNGTAMQQLGPYESEAQCNHFKAVVASALKKSPAYKTLVCTRGRTV